MLYFAIFCLFRRSFFRKPSSFSLAFKKKQQFFLEIRKITNSYLNLKRSSKTHQSSLTVKGGSTAFPKPLSPQGTGDVPTALLGAIFSKTHQSSLTLKGGSTSHLGLLPSGKKRKPLLLVALNRFAIRLADHQRSTPVAELRFFVRG